MIATRTDSAVDPDGVPYSGWTHAGPTARAALYRVYIEMLHGRISTCPDKFGISYMWFFPEPISNDGPMDLQRVPGDFRTLSGGSCSCKIVTAAIAKTVSLVASESCDEAQHSLKGRKIDDSSKKLISCHEKHDDET